MNIERSFARSSRVWLGRLSGSRQTSMSWRGYEDCRERNKLAGLRQISERWVARSGLGGPQGRKLV